MPRKSPYGSTLKNMSRGSYSWWQALGKENIALDEVVRAGLVKSPKAFRTFLPSFFVGTFFLAAFLLLLVQFSCHPTPERK